MGTTATSDWFLEHCEKLRDIVSKVSEINPDVYNEYREHTALKLFCVGYWSDIFTTIMRKRKIPTIFVDICSGSGLTKVPGEDRLLPGSTIVAESYASQSYDHIICVDSDVKRAKALENRLATIRHPSTFDVFGKRIEDAIDDVTEITNDVGGIFFCFYDPEGFKGLTWEVLDALGNLRGDILITWHQVGAYRLLTAGNQSNMDKIFGDNSYQYASDSSDLTERFITRLKLKRDIVEAIDIKDDQSRLIYKELLCVRETPSGSPWIRAFEDLKRRVEAGDSQAIDLWLSIAWGEQSQLNYF